MTPRNVMPCTDYESDYSALIDGELSPAREALLRHHVEACARCAGTVGALRGVDAALGTLPGASLPENLHSRLRARIATDAAAAPKVAPGRSAPGRTRRWRSAPAAVAAVAAAAVIALYLALPPGEETFPPGETTEVTWGEMSQLAQSALEDAPPEDVALAVDLETMEDFDVIANLELLEALVAMEEGTG